MPTRRSLGRGLMNAGAILGDYFQRQQAEDSIRRRQVLDDERAAAAAEAARRAEERARLETEYLKQNPSDLAAKLGRQRPLQDVASPISGDIAKADSLVKAPTDEDITQRYRTSGGRETLDSSNITQGPGGLMQATPNPGGAGVLEGLKQQAKAKRDTLTTEANQPDRTIEETNPDGSKTTKPYSLRTGGPVTTGLSAKQQGLNEGEKELAGQPGKTAAKVADMKGTWNQRFYEAEKMEAMKAAKQLANARETYKINHPEAATAAQDAIEATLGMEKIIALALELNKSNAPGAIDLYAGAKGAIATLPYVGTPIAGLMDTASSAVNAFQKVDPTVPGKVNTLQGMRRAAAIALIRAAGDPRPSNADVDGVMGSIPGYDESITTTAMKAKIMRDTALLLPDVIASNPGIKGKDLLDKVVEEAKKRSTSAATQDAPRDPSVKPVSQEEINAAPVPPPPGAAGNPVDRLNRRRAASGGR